MSDKKVEETVEYKFDVKFINENLNLGDRGLAQIICKYYTKRIIFGNTDTKINGFVWDTEKLLYKKYSLNNLFTEFSVLLDKAISFLICKVNENDLLDEIEKHKKIQNYNKNKKAVNNNNTIEKLQPFIISHYKDEETYTKMNSAENMIPLKGGMILDLKTEELRKRTQDDLFTYEKNYNYLGRDKKKYVNVDDFINKLCCENQEKKEFFKIILGYSITKETSLKCYFILYGPEGNNGKSTIMETMQNTFSEQYCALSTDLLYSKKEKEGINTKFANLIGKTIGTSSEPSYNFMDSSIIKLLTGNDSINAKKLYQDEITFKPTVKLFILSNKIVSIEDELAMKTRTIVFNFNAYFYNEDNKNEDIKTKYKYKADPNLDSKLKNEWRDEFFSYIVNCSMDFLKMKVSDIKKPKIIEEETRQYFEGGDIITKALNQKFIPSDNTKDKVLKSEIIEFYKDYCVKHKQDFKLDKITKYLNNKYGAPKRTSGFREDGEKVTGEYFYFAIKHYNNDLLEELEELEEQENNNADDDKKLKQENQELKTENDELKKQLEEMKQKIKELEEKLTPKKEEVVIKRKLVKEKETKPKEEKQVYTGKAQFIDIDIDFNEEEETKEEKKPSKKSSKK
jgi:P4 family phage/plasmid primase-like protien